MRIAIIDFVNQDIGLKILFPESSRHLNLIDDDIIYNNFLKKS